MPPKKLTLAQQHKELQSKPLETLTKEEQEILNEINRQRALKCANNARYLENKKKKLKAIEAKKSEGTSLTKEEEQIEAKAILDGKKHNERQKRYLAQQRDEFTSLKTKKNQQEPLSKEDEVKLQVLQEKKDKSNESTRISRAKKRNELAAIVDKNNEDLSTVKSNILEKNEETKKRRTQPDALYRANKKKRLTDVTENVSNEQTEQYADEYLNELQNKPSDTLTENEKKILEEAYLQEAEKYERNNNENQTQLSHLEIPADQDLLPPDLAQFDFCLSVDADMQKPIPNNEYEEGYAAMLVYFQGEQTELDVDKYLNEEYFSDNSNTSSLIWCRQFSHHSTPSNNVNPNNNNRSDSSDNLHQSVSYNNNNQTGN